MSIVRYVVYGSGAELDADRWVELSTLVRADGFDLCFDEGAARHRSIGPASTPRRDARSLTLSAGQPDQAGILLNFETRASNEALESAYWPPEMRPELEKRPRCLFLQATYQSDEPLDFWNCVVRRTAELLDGLIYDESSGELLDSYGNPAGARGAATDDEDDEDDDEEVSIDWSSLPRPSARPLTLVFRWDAWPSLYQLDDLLQTLEDSLVRNGSVIPRSGGKHPDTDRWRKADYLGAWGQCVRFSRANPGRGAPAYVRVMFDVDEVMAERDLHNMSELRELARKFVATCRERLRGFPIGVES